MKSFMNKEGSVVVVNMIKVIKDNKEYLSRIDGQIGDGDHGINMSKGFSICEKKITDEMNMTESLDTLSKVLLMEVGGSMGPLYGTFFKEMAKSSKEKKEITKKDFYEMINNSKKGLKRIGGAKVGDKTMMDTLIPAVDQYEKAIKENKSFATCLVDMEIAAQKGMESTKDMVAKIGRAARLGERSKGVLDAGAVSCYLILKSIVDSIQNLIN